MNNNKNIKGRHAMDGHSHLQWLFWAIIAAIMVALPPIGSTAWGDGVPDMDEVLPIVIRFRNNWSYPGYHISGTSSVVVTGKLKLVPERHPKYYEGELNYEYNYRRKGVDPTPRKGCPVIVYQLGCSGNKAAVRPSYLDVNYWPQIHKDQPAEFKLWIEPVPITAIGKVREGTYPPFCLKYKGISEEMMAGHFIIEGKLESEKILRGQCSWSGKGENMEGPLGVKVEDGEAVIRYHPTYQTSGQVNWVIGEPALLTIEQKTKTGWVEISYPDYIQPAVTGEKIELRGSVWPRGKDPGEGRWQIDFDGEHEGPAYIRKYEASDSRGQVVLLEDKDKRKSHLTFYWVPDGAGNIRYSTNVDGKRLEARARFEVKRPQVELNVTAQKESEFGQTPDGGWILAYQQGGKEGIRFEVTDIDLPGETQFVQIITEESAAEVGDWSERQGRYRISATGLDTSYPYSAGGSAVDNPGIPSDWALSDRTMHLQCRMYLMFKPHSKDGDNEWVPIKLTEWFWRGRITYDRATDRWSEVYSEEPQLDPRPVDITRYPEWKMNSKDFSVEKYNKEIGRWEETDIPWFN